MIWNLLWINILITLIFLSGFVENIDEMIQKKWKFHHLPKPFSCNLCSVVWASVLYILITGNLTIFNLMLCVLNGHLTEIVGPLITLIKNILLKIIEVVLKVIG